MTPTPLPRYNVLGVGISGVEPAAAVERVLQSARAGASFSASALAVHSVMEAQNDPARRAAGALGPEPASPHVPSAACLRPVPHAKPLRGSGARGPSHLPLRHDR